MMRKGLLAASLVSLLAAPALAQGVAHAPPGGTYKKVSELVKLPDFLPGLHALCRPQDAAGWTVSRL